MQLNSYLILFIPDVATFSQCKWNNSTIPVSEQSALGSSGKKAAT